MFITTFTAARPATCLCTQQDQSIPCPLHATSLRPIFTLSTHLRLGLPSVHVFWDSIIYKIYYAYVQQSMRGMG